MSGVLVQDFAFPAGLMDQPQFEMFEIAQAAMDQFGGATAGAGGKILFFDESGFQTARGGIERDSGAGYTPADDQDVELATGQLRDGFFPVEEAQSLLLLALPCFRLSDQVGTVSLLHES